MNLPRKEKARREAIDKIRKEEQESLQMKMLANLRAQLASDIGSTEGEEGHPEARTEDSSYTPPVEGADYVPDPQPEQQPKSDLGFRTEKADRRASRIKKMNWRNKPMKLVHTVGAGGFCTVTTPVISIESREKQKKRLKKSLIVSIRQVRSSNQQAQPNARPTTGDAARGIRSTSGRNTRRRTSSS